MWKCSAEVCGIAEKKRGEIADVQNIVFPLHSAIPCIWMDVNTQTDVHGERA